MTEKKGRTSEVRWGICAGSCGSTEALDAGRNYQKGFVENSVSFAALTLIMQDDWDVMYMKKPMRRNRWQKTPFRR